MSLTWVVPRACQVWSAVLLLLFKKIKIKIFFKKKIKN
jgi:hypothetical protein